MKGGNFMKKQNIITPVLITIFLILILIGYACIWLIIPFPWIIKIGIALVFLALIGVAVFVLIERIKEIRSGETDDLIKY